MKELADHLKAEREQRGATLKSISERARISLTMLRSLEEGDFERIGTALHIRNFIRAYCSALNIDPAPILEKYGEQILACDRQDEGIKRYGVWVKTSLRRRRIGKFWAFILVLAILGGVSGGAWFWKWRERSMVPTTMEKDVYTQQELPPDLPEKRNPSTEQGVKQDSTARDEKGGGVSGEAAEQKTREREVSSPASPKLQESLPAKPMAAGGNEAEVLREEKPVSLPAEGQKHRFVVEADQETWVQVKIDNKKTQEALLRPGEKREWEAEESMQIVVGNAGGVRMKWDGQPVDVPVKAGGVIRFQLPDPRYIKGHQSMQRGKIAPDRGFSARIEVYHLAELARINDRLSD